MRKLNWNLLAVWVCLSVLLYAAPTHAQGTKQSNKSQSVIELNQNPFDFVQEIVENGGRYNQSRGLASVAQFRTKSKTTPSLKYHKKYGASPEKAQAIYNALVQQYGQPKSIRGQSHVWDIENSDKSAAQADVVTVILKMEKSGAYELIMDRDRGENGKASWDATHFHKESQKKINTKKAKQQKLKSQLTMQIDND